MIEDVSPSDVAARLRSDAPPLLLDVREEEERRLAAIPGALAIPMGEVPARLSELPRHRPIIVYCHHGVRSLSVASWLAQRGYDNVANLTGGIDAWSTEVDPGVPRY